MYDPNSTGIPYTYSYLLKNAPPYEPIIRIIRRQYCDINPLGHDSKELLFGANKDSADRYDPRYDDVRTPYLRHETGVQ